MNHWMHTKLVGVLSLSLLAGGCSLLPLGIGAPKAPRALRPEIHEVAANPTSACLAQDERVAGATPRLSDQSQAAGSRQAAMNAPLTLDAKVCTVCGCNAGAAPAADWAQAAAEAPSLEPAGPAGFVAAAAGEDELQQLMDGNKRFVEGELENAYQWPTRPTGIEPANRRPPAAMILACSDWQTIPEAAFDSRPGELFVVRVAGNVADEAVVQSAKHAIERYDIPLIMVLGHESCGAVDHEHEGMRLEMDGAEGRPAAHAIRAADEAEADQIDAPIHANIGEAVQNLRRADAELGGRVAAGRLRIVGAYYDQTNGQITLEPDESLAPPAPEYVALPRD